MVRSVRALSFLGQKLLYFLYLLFRPILRIFSFPGPITDQSYTSFKKLCETFVAIVLQLSHLEELSAYLAKMDE